MNVEGDWLIKPKNEQPSYECAYDGNSLIELKNNKPIHNPNDSTKFLISKDSALMQDKRLYNNTKLMGNYASNELPEFEFTQGVPGCGKTTYIKNFVLNNNGVPSDSNLGIMVLFPTREGAKQFRNQIAENCPKTSESLLKRNFRTTHSLLLSNENHKFATLIMDEALMLHAGEILLCAKKICAQKVKLIGDTKQIPYINRLPQCSVKCHDPNFFSKCVEVLNVSYRCTQSTALILSQFYETKMYVTSNVNNEMKKYEFRNFQSIDFSKPNTAFLTFKQTEKEEIVKHCKVNNINKGKIFTIHEYQGQQESNIAVIRTTQRQESIYDSEPHIIVALSRHTKSFEYHTPLLTDKLSTLMNKAITSSVDNLTKFKIINNGGGNKRNSFE